MSQHNSPTANGEDELREILERSIGALTDAIEDGTTYLAAMRDNVAAEAILIHITYINERITAVEKATQALFRRTKTAVPPPTIVEKGYRIAKLLAVERATALKEERDRETTLKLALNAQKPAENRVVVQKPPLPPLPVPRFAGDVTEYRNFVSIFDSTVDSDTTIAPAQKLAYLKSYLDGEAKKLVADIIITDENYDIAKKNLQLYYGQSIQTITILYKRLQDLPKARNEPVSIRDTFQAAESILQMLEKEGQNVNDDKHLYGILLTKWPWSVIRQVMKHDSVDMKEFRKQMSADVELQIKLMQQTGYVQPSSKLPPSVPRTFEKPHRHQETSQNAEHQSQSSQQTPSSSFSSYTSSSNGGPASKKAKNGKDQQARQEKPPSCVFCPGCHFADACDKFTTASQRRAQIPDRCPRCFRMKHEGKCRLSIKCSHCPSYEHNKALCPVKFPDQQSKPQGDPHTMFTQTDAAGKFITLLTRIQNPETKQQVIMRVLIDPASDRTIMTLDAAKRIGLEVKFKKRVTTGLGGREVEPISEDPVSIEICPDENEPRTILTRLTGKISDEVRVPDVRQFKAQYPQFAEYRIPPTGKGQPIDLLIGTDKLVPFLRMDQGVFIHEDLQLMGSRFGWLILGNGVDNATTNEKPLTLFTHSKDAVEIMYDLDVLGLKHITDSEIELEQRAIDKFYETLTFLDEGRYEINWPWRSFPPELSENYGLAIGRLRSLYKKLSANQKFLQDYSDIIEQQIKDGIVEEVPSDQVRAKGVVHYIPHHAVIVPDKSTPIRIVYDASAALARCKSLNQCILKGKKWLKNVVGSLLRFRKYDVALTADIQRAFHQISIAPAERDAVRFIWIRDPSKPPEGENIRILRFKRVAFGIVASPFLLYATIQYHLRKNPTKYTDILLNEMYADNLLVSLPAAIDLKQFYEETKKTFAKMSMNMTKWKSNEPTLMNYIPQGDTITGNATTVLGLYWNTEADTISIKRPRLEHLKALPDTKRTILKTMASVFDPLGWVSPLILQAKLLLRELWKKNMPWDKSIAEEETKLMWASIKADLYNVETVAYQRQFFTTNISTAEKYEIHLFTDASTVALGAVIYLRAVKQEEAEVALIMSRTRLAPKAKLSVPRMELYAMLIGCRLLQFVEESLRLNQVKPTVIAWSDSKCVLAWIESDKMLPTAVERQLKEIRLPQIEQYRYVPTGENPADMASRGASLNEMKEKQWSSPPWLANVESWPQKVKVSEEDMEKEAPEVLFIESNATKDIPQPLRGNLQYYSELTTLLRKTAYRIYVLNKFIFKRNVIPVQTDVDYEAALLLWIRWDQRRNGSDSTNSIAQMKHLNQFQLFVDERGIVHCKTRFQENILNVPRPSQVILVKGSYLTKLIVLDVHQRNFHSGTSQTLAALRERYWLTHGRREVFSIIRKNCMVCKKYYAKPYQSPEMAPLPEFRITKYSQPFENTGIDVFGHVYTKPKGMPDTHKEKRWVLLMTCLVTRAIHLEVIKAMDTVDIICAIKRFTARRGTPKLILSDNAKQFKLVNDCLVDLWRHFAQDEQTSKYFAEQSINWRFIPENAPWMGGAYERMVGVVKAAIKKTYGERTMSDREFETTIIEVEGIVNNRPITYVDRNPDTVLLTPNHFLRAQFPAIPVSLDPKVNPKATVTKKDVLRYWKAAEAFLNEFWKCWSTQYLTELRNPPNVQPQQRIPKVGDVVLMMDPTQRRGYWRSATVERLMPSKADNKDRAAQIRLATGTKLIRPIVKLAPLELVDGPPVDEDAKLAASLFSVSSDGADEVSAESRSLTRLGVVRIGVVDKAETQNT